MTIWQMRMSALGSPVPSSLFRRLRGRAAGQAGNCGGNVCAKSMMWHVSAICQFDKLQVFNLMLEFPDMQRRADDRVERAREDHGRDINLDIAILLRAEFFA